MSTTGFDADRVADACVIILLLSTTAVVPDVSKACWGIERGLFQYRSDRPAAADLIGESFVHCYPDERVTFRYPSENLLPRHALSLPRGSGIDRSCDLT